MPGEKRAPGREMCDNRRHFCPFFLSKALIARLWTLGEANMTI
jgi:hypothetical protein